MSFKYLLKIVKKIVFTSIGISVINVITTDTAKAAPCPAEGSQAAGGAQTSTCNTTPTVMEIKFYELGFCTGDPLSGTNFDNSTCEKSWESTSGEMTDLANFSYTGLNSGLTFKVPNKRYDYAYVVFSPTWGLKGEVYFNNKTYYTTSDGTVTETLSEYDKFQMKLLNIDSNFPNGTCSIFSDNTAYGPVQARLTNSNLVSATDTSSCNAATRMVGSVDLNNPLYMTDEVSAYQLTWIIRDMGIEATDGGASDAPVEWKGGPFVPNFTFQGGATGSIPFGNNMNVITNE